MFGGDRILLFLASLAEDANGCEVSVFQVSGESFAAYRPETSHLQSLVYQDNGCTIGVNSMENTKRKEDPL